MGSPRNFMTPINAVDTSDLPDIVDVVMEMGHPDEAPSPPMQVLDSRQASLPAHLEKLADRARLRRGGEFGKHPSRLCRRLEAFLRLVPAPGV